MDFAQNSVEIRYKEGGTPRMSGQNTSSPSDLGTEARKNCIFYRGSILLETLGQVCLKAVSVEKGAVWGFVQGCV